MANFPLACFSMRHAMGGLYGGRREQVARGSDHQRLKGWKAERNTSSVGSEPFSLPTFQPFSLPPAPSSSRQRVPHPYPHRARLAEGDDRRGARFDAGVEEVLDGGGQLEVVGD